MSAKETLIKVENLQKYYKGGAIKALDGINTEIKKGEVVVVIGPSGSGKSTILNLIAKYYEPASGVICRQADISSLRGRILRTKKQTSMSTGRKWGWCSSILTFSHT